MVAAITVLQISVVALFPAVDDSIATEGAVEEEYPDGSNVHSTVVIVRCSHRQVPLLRRR